jgi:hypothetical protein
VWRTAPLDHCCALRRRCLDATVRQTGARAATSSCGALLLHASAALAARLLCTCRWNCPQRAVDGRAELLRRFLKAAATPPLPARQARSSKAGQPVRCGRGHRSEQGNQALRWRLGGARVAVSATPRERRSLRLAFASREQGCVRRAHGRGHDEKPELTLNSGKRHFRF